MTNEHDAREKMEHEIDQLRRKYQQINLELNANHEKLQDTQCRLKQRNTDIQKLEQENTQLQEKARILQATIAQLE